MLASGVAVAVLAPVIGGLRAKTLRSKKKTKKEHVANVSKALKKMSVVPTFGRCLCKTIFLLSPWHVGMLKKHYQTHQGTFKVQDASPLTTGRQALWEKRRWRQQRGYGGWKSRRRQ